MRKNELALSRRVVVYIARRKKWDLVINVLTGIISLFPLSFLLYLFFTIFSNAYFALSHTVLLIDGIQQNKIIDVNNREQILNSLALNIGNFIPGVTIDDVIAMLSSIAIHDFRDAYVQGKESVWVYTSSDFDTLSKKVCKRGYALSHKCAVLSLLIEKNKIKKIFNKNLFFNSDSRDPATAGVWGVMIGSLFTIFVCSIVSIPIGVMSAFCIEELMPRNKITRKIFSFVDISISNLASTPAIIYGILGLLLFVNFLHLPRSSALVGGLTLSFTMLPTVIITTKQAISSVPKSIKEAAIAMGASKIQVILHHTLPLSMPLIVTGSVLGIARVIGESAPLLMIGMAAFVADAPKNIFEPTTVFPIQIFLWASSPEPALIEKTSALIMLLFIILFLLNKLAAFIKKIFYVKFF